MGKSERLTKGQRNMIKSSRRAVKLSPEPVAQNRVLKSTVYNLNKGK